ncbi:hypothetical protein PM10SUCC1_08250 [Propionigenium maris DSM 9537]|uniref:Uncharacterized protein n=1 Tax=Propionigenium maris DSM 9537 TaxID=1123000 RepID=A0A9W6GKA1_9FUSO|nr:hypothetical protein [Propionigenium maris]GLI55311.1 hypothetical protein PM10SUCC1_08250 [Propionigenium maris DSM 9537]
MKRKLILSLFLLGVSLLLKDIVLADHETNSPAIKRYQGISLVETERATLSWIEEEQGNISELLKIAYGSGRLKVLSEAEELGVTLMDDLSGNNIVMVQGRGEVLLLTYSKKGVEKPYNLLEFKVEDAVVSMEQFNYIKSLITIRI